MAFEVGGRADKLGNRYEGKWLVRQLLRLLGEEIHSVTVEPIGDIEKGVDIYIVNKDDYVECHQCKARNASESKWTIADLYSKGILENAQFQIENNDISSFHLVSPFDVENFSDIILRAKNSEDSQKFYETQIKKSGAKTINCFENFAKYLNLNLNSKDDIRNAYNLLKRISIDVFPDTVVQKNDLLKEIYYLFVGDQESIYNLIKDFAIENGFLGKKITALILSNYLYKKGYSYRALNKDQKILPRIKELNTLFKDSFLPINKTIRLLS